MSEDAEAPTDCQKQVKPRVRMTEMQREEERASEERGKLSDCEAGGYWFPSCISQEPPCLVGLFGPQKKSVFDRPVLSLINLVSRLVVPSGGAAATPWKGRMGSWLGERAKGAQGYPGVGLQPTQASHWLETARPIARHSNWSLARVGSCGGHTRGVPASALEGT